MKKIHKEILVKGKVQGVYFRASAKSAADGLGINGTVKNLPDGNVKIVAEGEEGQLEAFIAWCRQGPPMAKITELAISVGEVGEYSGFEVIR